MHGNHVIDVGERLAGYGIAGENSLSLQLPRLDHRVLVVVTHRAMTSALTDRVERCYVDRVARTGDIDCRRAVGGDRVGGKLIVITMLTVTMPRSTGIDTSNHIDTLGYKEGIVADLVLFAISIMIGVVGSRLNEYGEYRVAVFRRIGFARCDDIVERVTRTVERIEDTRTHLAVHLRYAIRFRIVLQRTCRLGVDEVGMHHIQTAHHKSLIHIDSITLVDGAGANLYHIIVLGYQRICIPGETARPTLAVRCPLGSADTGYIYRIERGIGIHGFFPLRVGHTGARQGRGHLYRVIQNTVERIFSVPSHTLGLCRREFQVTLTLQTTGLYGAEIERIIRLGAGARERTRHIGVITRHVVPKHG